MAEQLGKLYTMARHAGLSLQYFFATDQAMMQVGMQLHFHQAKLQMIIICTK